MALLAVTGWMAALAAMAAAVLLQRELGRRGELVVRACHELRGPLAAARLGLELIGRPGAVARERVRTIDGELRRAGLALDDLYAARCGRRLRYRTEPVMVGDLVHATVEAWRPVAESAGGELRFDGDVGDVVVRGDRVRLAQACGNLVANGIEHGGRVVTVRVRTDALRTRIEVSDDGPGLPAPVSELSRAARGGSGHRGRGLAIAAEIAVRHGGRLAGAPAPVGARLALELPLAAGTARARA